MKDRKLYFWIGVIAFGAALIYTYMLNDGVWEVIPVILGIIGSGLCVMNFSGVSSIKIDVHSSDGVNVLQQSAGGRAIFSLDTVGPSSRFEGYIYLSGALAYPQQRPFKAPVKCWIPDGVHTVELARRDLGPWFLAEIDDEGGFTGIGWLFGEVPEGNETTIE